MMVSGAGFRAGGCFLMPVLAVLLIWGCQSALGERSARFLGGAGPVYPPELKARGVEGRVLVSYRVGVQGKTEDLRVLESEPPGLFDEAALQVIASWVFDPAKRGGKPVVSASLQSEVVFRLDSVSGNQTEAQ